MGYKVGKMTIIDIATLAGVSKTTVSRVINKDPTVSEKNREKVQAIMSQYNFFPSEAARVMKTGKSKTIGVITPFQMHSFFNNEFFKCCFQGIRDVLKEKDYNTIFPSGYGVESDAINKLIYQNHVEGIILLYTVNNDLNISVLEKANIPYVIVGPYMDENDKNIISYDNKHMMKEVLNYLSSIGKNSVAFFSSDKEISQNMMFYSGYTEWFNEKNKKVDDELVKRSLSKKESVFDALDELYQKGNYPDAIITSDITIQNSILDYTQLRKLNEPTLFSLEDSWLNEYLGISSVVPNFRLMGKMAGERILESISAPEETKKIELNYQMVIRDRKH